MLESSKSNIGYKDIVFFMVIVLLIVVVISNPSVAIKSATSGLYAWFNILLPSLFPFMILSDILLSSGFIYYFGKFLNPIMRPLFNLPGSAAFPLIMSSISGYPMGPKLTAKLRQDKTLTKLEANRLISFASTSGPLFILGSVGIGMLNSIDIKALLIIPHYLATISIGLIFRFYKDNSKETLYLKDAYVYETNNQNLYSNYKPISIGEILSNSIKNSINSILLVGGFVIFYSVIIEIIFEIRLINYLIMTLSKILSIDMDIIKGLLAGIVEITKGCQSVASLQVGFLSKIMMINFIIAWGGLSIHSQAISFISETDISQPIYLFSKMLHGFLAILYTLPVYILVYKNLAIPTSANPILKQPYTYKIWLNTFLTSTKLSLMICLFFILLSISTYVFFSIKKEA